MSLRPSVRASTGCVLALALVVLTASAVAQTATAAPPQQVTLTLDQDLITFAKWAVSLGGIFLVVFAGIGVLFFGWDVAQTRKAMLEARDDIAKRLESIRSDHAALKELKERLEQLGAKLEEQQLLKKAGVELEDLAYPGVPKHPPEPPLPSEPSTPPQPPPRLPKIDNQVVDELNDEIFNGRDHNQPMARRAEEMRRVLATSDFEWTTMGTLVKKTGIAPEDIEHILSLSDEFETIVRKGTKLIKLKNPIQWWRSSANTVTYSDEDVVHLQNLIRHISSGRKPAGRIGE